METSGELKIVLVPSDYTELFRQYYPDIQRIVRRAGIYPANVDDVAMAIITKFFENDALADYDPERRTCHQGVSRKAVFRTFLFGFVHIYLRHYVERQRTNARREPWSVTHELPSGERWVDVFGPRVETSYDDLFTEELLDFIRSRLKETEKGTTQKCSLVSVFDVAAGSVLSGERARVQDISEALGVSETTVRTRMNSLYIEVRKILHDWS